MKKRYGVILLVVCILALTNLSYRKLFVDNHPPTVKIIAPANNINVKPGTSVNYQLSVADKEDGDSKFDEINPKEVLLQVKYTKEKPKMSQQSGILVENDAPGLAVIRNSNCFNCHNFNGKAIGPSFFEISKRYPNTKTITDSLIKTIKNGSSGTWGKEKMPSHPELTTDEIRTTVQWILKNAASRDISYYNGLSGMIQLPDNRNGVYILTASYIDHGIKDQPAKHLKGSDRAIINVK